MTAGPARRARCGENLVDASCTGCPRPEHARSSILRDGIGSWDARARHPAGRDGRIRAAIHGRRDRTVARSHGRAAPQRSDRCSASRRESTSSPGGRTTGHVLFAKSDERLFFVSHGGSGRSPHPTPTTRRSGQRHRRARRRPILQNEADRAFPMRRRSTHHSPGGGRRCAQEGVRRTGPATRVSIRQARSVRAFSPCSAGRSPRTARSEEVVDA